MILIVLIFKCDGNMFQSCAMFLYPRPDEKAKIIMCSMQPKKNYTECVADLKLDAAKIHECTNGPQGIILQLRAEIETIKAKLAGIEN